MNLDTFFEKFDLFADAPNAVAKMRELILDLAVRGRLVSQVPTDESAAELVSRIRQERTELSEGKARKQRKSAQQAVTADLLPYDAPPGWCWIPLGELTTLVTSGSRDWAEHYSDDGAIFVRMGNLSRNSYHLRLRHIQHVKPPLSSEGSRTKLLAGDILISITGEVGLLGLIPPNFGEAYINQHTCLVRLPSELQNRYVAEFFRSSFAQEQFNAPQRGLKNSFRLTDVTSILIPLPPLAEQKRIVAKVDELMALCDRLEAQQQERETRHTALAQASLTRFADAPTPANLELLFHKSYSIEPAELRKSILAMAVRGQLVRFDAEENRKTVGEHVAFLNGYAFKSEWFKPSGIRLCRNANVGHGHLDWGDTAYVDQKVADEFQRFSLDEGDIVLSLDRPIITTGLKVAQVSKKDLPCLLLQRVAKPIPKHSDIDMAYFLVWLKSPDFVDSIDPGRSNGVPHISTRQVLELPFTLPPLPEQKRIVAKVEQLMGLVDRLEAQLAESRGKAAALLEAVVAELSGAG